MTCSLKDFLPRPTSIRDKARLLTLSKSTDTSGWIRAIPSTSLGLAMPGPEFLMSLKIWLGIPVLPQSFHHICACKSPVDIYGDHWMCCKFNLVLSGSVATMPSETSFGRRCILITQTLRESRGLVGTHKAAWVTLCTLTFPMASPPSLMFPSPIHFSPAASINPLWLLALQVKRRKYKRTRSIEEQ